MIDYDHKDRKPVFKIKFS